MADLPTMANLPWLLVALLGGGAGGAAIGERSQPPATPPAPTVVAPVAVAPSLLATRVDRIEADVGALGADVEELGDAQHADHMMLRDMNRSVGWIVLQTQKDTEALAAIAAAQGVVVDLFVAPLPQVDPP
jgi:hypothetical protein